jgi:hypothetical protein
MLGKRLVSACLLGVALLTVGVGHADVNCTGGINGNCVGPGGYVCNVPLAPIGGSVTCSPTCTASGQVAVPSTINVSATGMCGIPVMGVQKDCPPLFTSSVSINGAMHTTTWTETATFQAVAAGVCLQVSSNIASSTCGMHCTCQ